MQDLGWGAFNQTGDFWLAGVIAAMQEWKDTSSPAEIKGRVWHAGDTWSDEFNFSETAAPHNEILNGNGNDFMVVPCQKTLHSPFGEMPVMAYCEYGLPKEHGRQ